MLQPERTPGESMNHCQSFMKNFSIADFEFRFQSRAKKNCLEGERDVKIACRFGMYYCRFTFDSIESNFEIEEFGGQTDGHRIRIVPSYLSKQV